MKFVQSLKKDSKELTQKYEEVIYEATRIIELFDIVKSIELNEIDANYLQASAAEKCLKAK